MVVTTYSPSRVVVKSIKMSNISVRGLESSGMECQRERGSTLI